MSLSTVIRLHPRHLGLRSHVCPHASLARLDRCRSGTVRERRVVKLRLVRTHLHDSSCGRGTSGSPPLPEVLVLPSSTHTQQRVTAEVPPPTIEKGLGGWEKNITSPEPTAKMSRRRMISTVLYKYAAGCIWKSLYIIIHYLNLLTLPIVPQHNSLATLPPCVGITK